MGDKKSSHDQCSEHLSNVDRGRSSLLNIPTGSHSALQNIAQPPFTIRITLPSFKCTFSRKERECVGGHVCVQDVMVCPNGGRTDVHEKI